MVRRTVRQLGLNPPQETGKQKLLENPTKTSRVEVPNSKSRGKKTGLPSHTLTILPSVAEDHPQMISGCLGRNKIWQFHTVACTDASLAIPFSMTAHIPMLASLGQMRDMSACGCLVYALCCAAHCMYPLGLANGCCQALPRGPGAA